MVHTIFLQTNMLVGVLFQINNGNSKCMSYVDDDNKCVVIIVIVDMSCCTFCNL